MYETLRKYEMYIHKSWCGKQISFSVKSFSYKEQLYITTTIDDTCHSCDTIQIFIILDLIFNHNEVVAMPKNLLNHKVFHAKFIDEHFPI